MTPPAGIVSVPPPPPPPTPPPGAWLSPWNSHYPPGAPILDSIPASDRVASPWGYSEDDFASLWTQIYEMLTVIGYINKDDIIYPPPDTGRHVLDRVRLQQHFNMSDRVVSLLERLPYPKPPPGGPPQHGEWEFFTECTPFDYLNMAVWPGHVRDPHWGNMLANGREDPLPDYLLPDDVALVSPIATNGLTWILDTKTNGIRSIWDIAEIPPTPEGYELERPDQPDHYRNWPSFPATFILRRYLQDLYELERVPIHGESISTADNDLVALLISHTMRTAYGWPGSFRREDWLRDRERITKSAWKLTDGMSHVGGRFAEREHIKLWREDPTQIPPLE